MKETIKNNYGVQVQVDSALMTWTVKHAAWLHNRYQLHTDGKTSYSRRWNHDYIKPICEFAETVLFHYAEPLDNKTTPKWTEGIWLGRCTQSDEHFVGTKDNVFRTRTIRRLPKSDRYKKELLEGLQATPWSTRGVGRAPTDDFVLNLPRTQQSAAHGR